MVIHYCAISQVICLTQNGNNEIFGQQKNVTLIVICIPFLLKDKNWETRYSSWDLNILNIILIVTRSMLNARNGKETYCRNSCPEVFFGKGTLKIYSKFTGEHSKRRVISIKLQSTFGQLLILVWCVNSIKSLWKIKVEF